MIKIEGRLWNMGTGERRENIYDAMAFSLMPIGYSGNPSDYKLTYEISESGLPGLYTIEVYWCPMGTYIRINGLCEEDVTAERVWEFLKEQDEGGQVDWLRGLLS